MLDTQTALGPRISALSRNLAELTSQVRSLDPTLAELFANGAGASAQLAGLVHDNSHPLATLSPTC